MPTTATFASRALPKTSATERMLISIARSAALSAKSGAWIWKDRPPSLSAIIVETWFTSV